MLTCTTTAALSVADPPENTLFSSAAGYPKKNVTTELQQTKGLAEPTPPGRVWPLRAWHKGENLSLYSRRSCRKSGATGFSYSE